MKNLISIVLILTAVLAGAIQASQSEIDGKYQCTDGKEKYSFESQDNGRVIIADFKVPTSVGNGSISAAIVVIGELRKFSPTGPYTASTDIQFPGCAFPVSLEGNYTEKSRATLQLNVSYPAEFVFYDGACLASDSQLKVTFSCVKTEGFFD